MSKRANLTLHRGGAGDPEPESAAVRGAILQERVIASMTDVAKHLRADSPNRVVLDRAIDEAKQVVKMMYAQCDAERAGSVSPPFNPSPRST